MPQASTKSQNLFLNSLYREAGTIYNPQFSLPSTLIQTQEENENMYLTLVDLQLPYWVYNIFQYSAEEVYPCAEANAIQANNNFTI